MLKLHKMIKQSLIILIFLNISLLSQAQQDTNTLEFVNEMPTFQDDPSMAKFHSYVNSNIDLSKIDSDLISGSVIVGFCIDTLGNTTEIKIMKSLRGDFDTAVINTIRNSPKWTPAELDGRPVKVFLALPVNFDFQ
jgi:hypothetical protein